MRQRQDTLPLGLMSSSQNPPPHPFSPQGAERAEEGLAGRDLLYLWLACGPG